MARNTTASSSSGPETAHAPKVNKDPFYRTNDILNAVFKKKVRLEKGDRNCTDLKTIWVNFNEVRTQPIVRKLGITGDRHFYTLNCGHAWDSKNEFPIGKYIPCWPCGNAEAYKGFEHEWEHIVFKSDLAARSVFVDRYAQSLRSRAPGVNLEELKGFLHLFINAFDDIRVNSLQERVYPGSAHQLWERWKRLLQKDDYNQVFLAFTMAIGLNLPVDPQGPFYALFPILEWGMAKSKYRSFGRMLFDIRVVIDRCMGAILAHVPPPDPPQPPQPPSQQSPQVPPPPPPQQGQSSGTQDGKSDRDDVEEDPNQPGGAQGIGQAGGNPQGDSNPGQRGGDVVPDQEPTGSSAGKDGDPEPPRHIPSSAQVDATESDRDQALAQMMAGAKPVDDKEDHPVLSQAEQDADPSSQSTKLMVAQLMDEDIEDLDAIDASQPATEPDEDMQQQIDTLRSALGAVKSKDNQLTSDAKAKITLIDVRPYHIDEKKIVVLDPEEETSVERIRAIFFRELGRKKAWRDVSGPAVDIPAFVQFKVDRKDPEVFEGQQLNRGFAYHVLADMSGSMGPLFPTVGRAMVMLRDSLDFPFVQGGFWGFRGGGDVRWDPVKKVSDSSGEVWLYRYDRECQGFEGRAPITLGNGVKVQMPVACGSITPMNSALNVAIRHMDRNVPSGMAKRLYLLTDGQPLQMRTDGRSISDRFLKQFVAGEIRWARAHGIEVYTIIIGKAIPDEDARTMFGHPRYWVRSGTDKEEVDSVDVVLAGLVMRNFSKYLKAR